MIEPGDIIIWPVTSKHHPDSAWHERYLAGHVELGCDFQMSGTGERFNWQKADPGKGLRMLSFWPFGVRDRNDIPNGCLIFRNVSALTERRMIMDLGFAGCRNIILGGDRTGTTPTVAVRKDFKDRGDFPKYAGTVQSLFLSGAAKTSNVTHALKSRYAERAESFIDNYLDYLNDINSMDGNGAQIRSRSVPEADQQILKQVYCSQFAVVACQLAAFTAVKRFSPNQSRDELIASAAKHPLWINLRPKTTYPWTLADYLRRSDNWRFLGTFGEWNKDEKTGQAELISACNAALTHYKQNKRSKWGLTSSFESVQARQVLEKIVSGKLLADPPDGGAGVELRYLIAVLLSIDASATFRLGAPGEQAVKKDAIKKKYHVLPLGKKTRLRKCLMLAVRQWAREQFVFDPADVDLQGDEADLVVEDKKT